MFWDKAARRYDLFEELYNRRANEIFCRFVAEQVDPEDNVLECACGTGMISLAVAPNCAHLTATDYSEGMLLEARKKCADIGNITVEAADIMKLPYPDASFDKVIAGNVIHLLDDPAAALRELSRVCRPGGRLIIPTYVNRKPGGKTGIAARLLQKSGAGFRRQFDYDSYQEFFAELGYKNAEFFLAGGRMPCAVAVIEPQG